LHPDVASVRFLFLGTFSRGRGLEELLEGWARLNDPAMQLHLRGPDSPEREKLMQLADQGGLLGRTVHFEPAVLERQLVECAAEYDVGVIPYKPVSLGYRYCCPNKLSQYMQAGLAILTNDLVYVKELVSRFHCGLHYDSSDVDTLTDAVRALHADRQNLQRLRHNAFAAAQSEFNWQRQSIALYDAYRRLA